MARALTAAAKTESLKTVDVRIFNLVKLEFDSGDVTVWNGRGNIVFDGDTYTGIGDLGRVSGLEEGIEQRAFGIAMELGGVPASSLNLALDEDLQNRKVQVWLGFFDSSYAIIADPMLAFRGRMDTMDITLGKEATIVLTAESRLRDWGRPRIRRYTDADQQSRFSGDLFFQFVSDTTEKEIVWGGKVAGWEPPGRSGSSGGTTTNRTGGGGEDPGTPSPGSSPSFGGNDPGPGAGPSPSPGDPGPGAPGSGEF